MRRVRWRTVRIGAAMIGAAGLSVSVAPVAFAHPLGNFTINTAAGLVVGVDEVVVDYAGDMAEIPHRAGGGPAGS